MLYYRIKKLNRYNILNVSILYLFLMFEFEIKQLNVEWVSK